MVNEDSEDLKKSDFHNWGSTLVCHNGHNHFVLYSCSPKSQNQCKYCLKKRSGEIMYKLFRKMVAAGYGEVTEKHGFVFTQGKSVSMWTLGTNIKYLYASDAYGEPFDNTYRIMSFWQKFNTRMKVYSKRSGSFRWNPLFYVIEAGSEGNYLHIHLLVDCFLPHDYIRKQWSSVTGIPNPNVNFLTPLINLGYVAKYTSKGALTYRFLKQLYKMKLSKKDTSCKTKIGNEYCNSKFEVVDHGEEYDVWVNDQDIKIAIDDEWRNAQNA